MQTAFESKRSSKTPPQLAPVEINLDNPVQDGIKPTEVDPVRTREDEFPQTRCKINSRLCRPPLLTCFEHQRIKDVLHILHSPTRATATKRCPDDLRRDVSGDQPAPRSLNLVSLCAARLPLLLLFLRPAEQEKHRRPLHRARQDRKNGVSLTIRSPLWSGCGCAAGSPRMRM